RAARRGLEAELESTPEKIKQALRQADREGLAKLKARQVKLPDLYVEASMTERHAGEAYYKSLYDAAEKAYHTADAAAASALESLREVEARHAVELKSAQDNLSYAERERNTKNAAFTQSNGDLAASETGYRRALERLAEA